MNQANGDELLTGNDAIASIFRLAFDASPHAQLLISASGLLVMYNEKAGLFFGLASRHFGRPIQDLETSFRPIGLRSIVSQTIEQRRPTVMRDVALDASAREQRRFDIHVVPLTNGSRLIAISVSFVDISRIAGLQTHLSRARQELETMHEELQSTNEELETTNEQLRSTIEELETMSEQLQTIAEEAGQRSDELNRSNGLLESILRGVRSGALVLDRELRLIAWSHRAEDLWGLRTEGMRGQNFFNLEIGLPTEKLRGDVRAVLQSDSAVTETTVRTTNRRGEWITCRVTTTALLGTSQHVSGVIMLVEEQAQP